MLSIKTESAYHLRNPGLGAAVFGDDGPIGGGDLQGGTRVGWSGRWTFRVVAGGDQVQRLGEQRGGRAGSGPVGGAAGFADAAAGDRAGEYLNDGVFAGAEAGRCAE